MAQRRTDRAPALLASTLAHAALLATAVIAWPWLSKDVQLGKVVPVTLVVNGPPADLAPAEQAPTPTPAMAPAPDATAPPQPAPLSPAPPTPAAVAATSKPSQVKPAKSAPAKPTNQGLDLDALMSSIASSTQRPSTPATSGLRGPVSSRTDVTAEAGQGTDNSQSSSEFAAVGAKLTKLWNPNCQVENAAHVNFRVRMRLTSTGQLIGAPELLDKASIDASGDPILIASAQRAVSAAGRGAPYTELNPKDYSLWRDQGVTVTFNGKTACAK